MEAKDRRKYPRLEGEFPVDLLNMGDDPMVSPFEAIVSGTCLDVSRQGMRLKATYNVPIGTLLSAIVYYKNRESVCLCEVIWKREYLGQPLYGVYIKQWSQMDPSLEDRLSWMENADASRTDGGDAPLLNRALAA